ncbi:unnamed protein product [Rotaria sp. Silwood1]|nr:unnamed protein product [Rotaria sp. Silwood1]
MSFGTNWWIIKSKKNTGVENEEHKISVFENGFYIDKSELEKLDSEELKRFLRSLKEDQLPDAMLKSPYYPGDHVNYYFTIKEKEMGTSLAWRNYESEEVELNKYDPEWSNLYKKEYENILSHLPINENCCEHDQLLMLEMEHIGSTNVEGIFIIHIVMDYAFTHWKRDNLIAFREYLRAHSDARDAYSQHKKSLIANKPHLTIADYATRKDNFVNQLFHKANEWYRQNENYVHIGDFDEVKNQWSCCKASREERNRKERGCASGGPDSIGCCQPGLQKDSYHPGRFLSVEYNFVKGWWTCCSQGHYSDGCVKVRLLSNGDGNDTLKYFS